MSCTALSKDDFSQHTKSTRLKPVFVYVTVSATCSCFRCFLLFIIFLTVLLLTTCLMADFFWFSSFRFFASSRLVLAACRPPHS